MNEDIEQYYNQFKEYLESFNKNKALEYSIMLLSEGKATVQELYEEIIGPSLNNIVISRDEEDQSIWKEHIMTNIARTIIECSYPYVLKEREKIEKGCKSKRVLVLCPEEEYHEIGARMGADFFTIAGFDVFYIGCNTPKENFISAINFLKPNIIAISITNYLNLISLKKIIAEIKEKIGNQVMIVISGSALKYTKKTAADFGVNAIIGTFEEVNALREGLT